MSARADLDDMCCKANECAEWLYLRPLQHCMISLQRQYSKADPQRKKVTRDSMETNGWLSIFWHFRYSVLPVIHGSFTSKCPSKY